MDFGEKVTVVGILPDCHNKHDAHPMTHRRAGQDKGVSTLMPLVSIRHSLFDLVGLSSNFGLVDGELIAGEEYTIDEDAVISDDLDDIADHNLRRL